MPSDQHCNSPRSNRLPKGFFAQILLTDYMSRFVLRSTPQTSSKWLSRFCLHLRLFFGPWWIRESKENKKYWKLKKKVKIHAERKIVRWFCVTIYWEILPEGGNVSCLHMCKQRTFPPSYVCTCANKEYFLPQLLKKQEGNEFEGKKCIYGNVSFHDTKLIHGILIIIIIYSIELQTSTHQRVELG